MRNEGEYTVFVEGFAAGYNACRDGVPNEGEALMRVIEAKWNRIPSACEPCRDFQKGAQTNTTIDAFQVHVCALIPEGEVYLGTRCLCGCDIL